MIGPLAFILFVFVLTVIAVVSVSNLVRLSRALRGAEVRVSAVVAVKEVAAMATVGHHFFPVFFAAASLAGLPFFGLGDFARLASKSASRSSTEPCFGTSGAAALNVPPETLASMADFTRAL